MMKVLRISVAVLFLITTAVFSFIYINELSDSKDSAPVITLETDVLEVSVNATEQDLLKGVTAFDKEDGDLTNEIIIESISMFVKKGVCKITYAVCDSKNHVTDITRKLVYTDYESPVFTLNRSLCFSLYEIVNIKNAIDVNDCFDGALNNSMIITSQNYSMATAGIFSVDAVVTNSKGDTVKLTLPIIVEERSTSAPTIELNEYLIYADKGAEIDFNANIAAATDYLGEDITDDVEIDAVAVDMNTEGMYTVHYYVSDSKGVRGHNTLIVIVGS